MRQVEAYNLQIKDQAAQGHEALVAGLERFLELASKRPELSNTRSNNLDDTAQFAIDIDDRKTGSLGLATGDVNGVLSSALGGTYINDFLNNGRVKKVYMQGDAPFRMLPDDIDAWSVRNSGGDMVPFSAFASKRWTYGAPQLQRYNGSSAYEIVGDPAPGVSSGVAMDAIESVMKALPRGIGFEWTGASYQERLSGSQAPALYAVSILFVFLCLAALYESWSVPFSVILAVPLGIVGALAFTSLRGLTNDVYFQVGLLTTVGLSSKNAILIVEFAKQLQERGVGLVDATVQAVRQRLRPILMTSLAFGFGVLPLALGTGAGSGGRAGGRAGGRRSAPRCSAACSRPPCWASSSCRCSSCGSGAGSATAAAVPFLRERHHDGRARRRRGPAAGRVRPACRLSEPGPALRPPRVAGAGAAALGHRTRGRRGAAGRRPGHPPMARLRHRPEVARRGVLRPNRRKFPRPLGRVSN